MLEKLRSVDEAAGTVTGLLRLEGSVGWLAVGVAASAEGMMTGAWAVIGEPGGAAGGFRLNGQAKEEIVAETGPLREASLLCRPPTGLCSPDRPASASTPADASPKCL